MQVPGCRRTPWVALVVGTALVCTIQLSGDDSASSELAKYDAIIKVKDREHWAFQPVRRPSVPAIRDTSWVRNPIDAFVLAKLEARGWKPSPPAEPHQILRRVYLDLVGLPPSLAEQRPFLRDPSPEALDRVIEELLSRPGYGERWARHWLDWVRYAESNGYERDAAKPLVWRYRDYVIRAFNDDKPYDRFIVEQLAGDELPDASAETLIATGYTRLGPWDDEPADPKEDRFDQLDDLVNTTSQVFLGLTLACARCHNHKLEPLTMHDYYRMVAIFDPLQRPQRGRTELTLPAGSRSEIAQWQQQQSALAATAVSLHPVQRAAALHDPWSREGRLDVPQGYFLHEPAAGPGATHLLIRGKATRPGPAVAPGLPSVLVSRQPEFPPPDGLTSRRRLTLAKWIASPDNALTARVLVNRVWQQHFGEGLVRTASDFGTHGDRPVHAELLDWLADWFTQEGGWSLKRLHRLILTSSTARMSKRWNEEYGRTDPENRLLWRVPYRRLEVEAIRDSMLAVSGRLNPLMFGPSMYPEVPKEALAGSSDPDKIWKPFDEAPASRRTIYAFVKRSFVVPLLEVLDLCDTTRSSSARQVTTVAPQALSLFNGEFVNRQARHLAARLVVEAGDSPGKQVGHLFRLALCRQPTEREQQEMETFLRQEAKSEGVTSRALEQLCRVVLNLNEFVYSD